MVNPSVPNRLNQEPPIETLDNRREPTRDSLIDTYQPRTELGKRLLALRRSYVMAGGRLLDPDALDEEARLRRGGVSDV